mgnify:CR=1 FL=1
MRKYLFFFAVFYCLILVSCGGNNEPEVINGLESVSSELVTFEYIPDTGNNSSRLRYKIRFTNPNFQIIEGIYRITLNIDETESTTVSNSQSPCAIINGYSSCSVSFNEESCHDNGIPNSIEFVSAEYTIVE